MYLLRKYIQLGVILNPQMQTYYDEPCIHIQSRKNSVMWRKKKKKCYVYMYVVYINYVNRRKQPRRTIASTISSSSTAPRRK